MVLTADVRRLVNVLHEVVASQQILHLRVDAATVSTRDW